MSDPDQKSLEQILSEAETLPAAQRESYLRDACESDELYSRAMDLLYADDAGAESLTGQLVGPYRIKHSLGRGGMGEVFLAERDDRQFQQQVALKIVRPGLLSKHVQGRLRQERQILASLAHPNIARLYDGGTTEDGVPYIVMEYIEGVPIDAYCDQQKLDIEFRLRLFVTVCAAVHRAHQSLIVHRDLKPSNILVTNEGVPKLLDFGIAKVLDGREMMHTLAVTQLDVRVLTPDHASPEQLRGDPITTASDIYVLGILLHELLCGYKPFGQRKRSLAELERAICDETPPAPSAVVGNAARSLPAEISRIAADRSTSVTRLQRELRGDLDNIVAMATRKEPERRYASVEQLAADINAYLQGMPVKARADSWHYRSSKFLRRHATVAALSFASLILLIGFAVTTYIQSHQIAFERDHAESQRVRAEAERERAEAVSAFLIDSFRAADPARSRGDSITASEILDRGAERIARELRSQPELQATLLDTIGSVYLGLGMPEKAQPLVEHGLSIRRTLDPGGLDVARSLYNLNTVYEKKGDLDTAEALAEESLEIAETRTGPQSLETAEQLCRLGFVKREKGELQAAETHLERCLVIREKLLGSDHEKITTALDNLSRIAQARGDLLKAEKLVQRAIEIGRKTLGTDHPRYIAHLSHLALLKGNLGETREAEALYREVIDLCRRVMGPTHPETIDALSELGALLLSAEQIDDAQPVLEEVLRLNAEVRGPRHAYVGNDHENLGRLALSKGNLEEAESRFLHALDIYGETLAPGHGMVASAWGFLGRVKLAQGKPADAEDALERALAAWQIEYGPDSTGYAVAEALRARAWFMQGRLAETEEALLRLYPKFAASNRAGDVRMASDIRTWIQDLYRELDRPDAATEYFSRVHPKQ